MRIDVHAHYWTDDYLDLLGDLGNADVAAVRGIGAGDGAELAARLRLMDRAGIQMQVLSACPQSPYGEDAVQATKAARFVNDQYAELAAAADADPVRFRLAHLTDPRARQVLTQAADMAGWGTRARRAGTGYGAGVARYSGVAGYCAAVAEVEADTDIRVRRLWLAVDVGRVINPDGVINQVEGGAVQSASWTLREQVRFDRDRITSAGWDSYPILRFTETPEVTVRIVGAPGEAEVGAGEIAQGPVAGAIGNAVADAVGVRVRDLPLTRDRVARAIEES